MTNAQKDEQVLASIIAAGKSSRRRILPASGIAGHSNGYGVTLGDDVRGPACAVGAGVLFAGIAIVDSALDAFAAAHAVPVVYACGVSDGFEEEENWGYYWSSADCRNYRRGLAVGAAARVFFGSSGRG